MGKLKLLELFGGIGACSKALERLGIDYEIVDYVEIDKYAVKSFNAIHNTNFEPQDIKEWDKDVKVDLIMHGSPCQDFSLAGKQAGGDKDSGTRSSLMYETIRIVEKLKPKYVVWENVKNLLSKKHRHNFDAYLETMGQLGYTNYYQVLNAKDYGIPQNRERVFTVSILGNEKYDFPKGDECNNKIDVVGNYMPSGHDASRIVNENGLAPTVKENHGTVTAVAINFEFPPKQPLKLKLKDMLEDEVDEKYYLSKKMMDYMTGINQKPSKFPRAQRFYSNINRKNQNIANSVTTNAGNRPTDNFIRVKNNTKQGYLDAYEGDGVYTNTSTKRGTVQKDMIQTLTTFQDKGVVVSDKPRKDIKELEIYCEYCGNKLERKRFNDRLEDFTVFSNRKYCNRECMRKDWVKIGDNHNQSYSNAHTKYEKNKDKTKLRIRKLTPREVWRLMGFDDEDFEKASKVNSNTQLYKQAGNSIVVNVLEAIFKNLLR